MKRSFVVAATLALVIHPISTRSQEVLDGIAAVVNHDVITFSQVRELVGPAEAQARRELRGEALPAKIKEIRLKAINDLIDRQLILQEFSRNKFNIPDHFIEDRVGAIVREEFGGDRNAFVRTLQAQGYTFERFKNLEKEKMIVQAMRTQNVKSDIIIPEPRIQEYYQKNRGEFSEDDQIKLRMIAIRRAEDGSDSRRTMVEEIRSKIVEGAEFQDLARMYSEDSTQDQGGDWGWINRRTLNETLSKAAFSLKPGQVSQILELGNSYYLLLVEAKKNATVKPFAQLRDNIQAKLIQEERRKREDEWIARLRKKAYIKMF
jgi:peptidyl-prolyl cis-trans isomerase SurA